MSNLSLQLSLPPRKRRLTDLPPPTNTFLPLPAGAVFDLDATLSASYPGSGQIFTNLVDAPADSSAKSSYDFFLGLDATLSTDDPSFVGSAGSKASYFSLDGGDTFTAPLTSTLKNLYKPGAALNFTLVTAFEYVADAATQHVCGQTSTGTDPGMRLQIIPGGELRVVCIGSSTPGVSTLHSGLISGTRYLHVLTFDNTTKAYKSAINSRAFTTTGTNTAGSNTSDPLSSTYRLGRAGGPTVAPMANGSKIIAHAMLIGFTPTDAQLSALVDIYNARHGRTYA